MRANRIKQMWSEGKAAIGSWMNYASPACAEVMTHLGFDWLVVDAEHSQSDFQTIEHMVLAIGTTDTVPIVRVPAIDEIWAKRVLDAGAYGVIFPMVNTREEAQRAVSICRYPPVGVRGMGFGRAELYAGKDYKANANREVAVIIQIEHIDAVGRIDELFSVPGVDAYFIGPGDLAASMGIPVVLGDNPDPRHREAVRTVVEAGKKHGIPAGIHVASADDVNRRIKEGFQFIALGTDSFFLTGAARAALAQVSKDRAAGSAGPG